MNAMQIATTIDAIATLDLNLIKTKLMHEESGEGWSAVRADAVEVEYRRFLILMKLYPNDVTAPVVDVDTFWHYHILDTAKYAADCDQVFGYFLHHYPYLGMGGETGEAMLARAGERMQELYAATFGARTEAAPAAWCGSAQPAGEQAAAWCGAAQPAGPQTAAWCGAAQPAAEKAAAWCGATTAVAWCGAATQQSATAWCGAATQAPAQQAVAWCGAATAAPVKQTLAWCGAATNGPAKAAWCGAAQPNHVQVSEDITLTVKQA